MHLLCLGLNHTTAPIDLREQLAFNEEQLRAALARQGCGGSQNTTEMVILSTCNRTEIFAASLRPDFRYLEEFLSEARGLPKDSFQAHLYRYRNEQTVRHLLQVAAGLDSLVLGEPQILGQVTRALELARGQSTVGPMLSRLFQAAIHAGKRARTETEISRNPVSVSSLAASLCEQQLNNLAEAQIAILGAGEMAELAVEALRKRGAQKIIVVNRTLARAKSLAARWGAEAATYEQLQDALARADILISSTGAPHIILNRDMIAQALSQRPQRSLVLIDIAVPRDIDPSADTLPQVRLYDIDSLSSHVEQSMAGRVGQVPLVQSILEQETQAYLDYLEQMDMLPIIASMRQQAEAIRQAELTRTLRRLPNLTPTERQRVEALSEALVKKLLSPVTRRLRLEAACPHAPEYATVARSLFDLPGENTCNFSGQPCPLHLTEDPLSPIP